MQQPFSVQHGISGSPGGLLIQDAQPAILFNPEPQATVSGNAIACGSGLND